MNTIITETTTLLCGITEKGNAVAIDKAQPELRYLVSTSGEFRADAGLNFPAWILHDTVTGLNGPEALLRSYYAQKQEEKAQRQFQQQMQEEAALAKIKAGYGSYAHALSCLQEYQARRKHVEPTAKALRAALKKVEAAAARKKETEAWKKRCEKACAALTKKGPAKPVKGAGFSRVDFPTVGNNKKLAAVLAAIPARHKDEVAVRTGKGRFRWSPAVSPEAMAKVDALIKEAQA